MHRPRLYIFDADGTLRWTTIPGQPCPNGPGEWQLMPGVRQKLRLIQWGLHDARLGIASNQGGVAAGFMTREVAVQLMVDMLVDAIGYIPPGTNIQLCTCSAAVDCLCRKPQPGMLLNIMEHFGTAPEDTLYVGDLEIDREAARRAGVPFRWAADFFGWNAGSM